MNSAVRFPFVLIIMTYQTHDQFWDFGFKSMSSEMFVGRNVIPLPSFKKTTSFEWLYTEFVWMSNCFAWVSSIVDDGSIFADPGSLSFVTDLSNAIQNLWDCGLDLRDATPPRNGFSLGISIPRVSVLSLLWKESEFRFRWFQDIYDMNLKNWSNYRFILESLHGFWNLNFHEEVCILCMKGFGLQTIINVRNSFVAHPNGDSSGECRILTNSRKLDILLRCFKSLKTFSQSVSRWTIIAPGSLH